MRVSDWRVTQIEKLRTVTVYRESPITADDVLEFGASHVVLATGAVWRRDGVGRSNGGSIPGFAERALTPDDLMAGRVPSGHVVIFDDDAFYMGSLMAELVVRAGGNATIVTPDDTVAIWSANTLEYRHLQKRLHALGVRQVVSSNALEASAGGLVLQHAWSGARQELGCDALVSVTSRLPQDGLHADLLARAGDWAGAGVRSVECIGDALAPGLIAHAVYAGHRYAREFGEPRRDVPFRRHLPVATSD
jgi:dimethylamine/trimethylamine dehydrogenase